MQMPGVWNEGKGRLLPQTFASSSGCRAEVLLRRLLITKASVSQTMDADFAKVSLSAALSLFAIFPVRGQGSGLQFQRCEVLGDGNPLGSFKAVPKLYPPPLSSLGTILVTPALQRNQ